MKRFLAGFFICYLLCGFLIGSALKFAVPATNYYCGVSFITLIWPAWIAQPFFHYSVRVPGCAFTFKHSSYDAEPSFDNPPIKS